MDLGTWESDIWPLEAQHSTFLALMSLYEPSITLLGHDITLFRVLFYVKFNFVN
jgi:hypothetical protein